jgi:serine/threonine-protein kinase
MTRLDTVIARARNTPVSRDSAERYIRDLHRRATSPGTGEGAIGDSIGSYEIVRKIGEGGMGVVYLATHSILGRRAAVKVLLPELSRNRDMVDRFFNEARAAASIRHPGIVDIYDFGFAADGSGYIAMELLEGETLRSRLRRQGRLSVESTIEIGRQIASALQAAHDKGITHRDLKPDNVFLVADPEIAERVKLLDFGIAKLAGDNPGGPHTRTGTVMGTPLYMSPEQCRGADTLDGRSDLYSLGCILYELLAGRPVFPKQSANDVVAHHLYFEPEPVRRHEPAVPEPLEKLIDRLLCKDPAGRPSTAADVAASLERCRTSARPPTGPGSSPPGAPQPEAAERTEHDASTTLSEAAGASTTLSEAAGTVRRTGAVTSAPRHSKRVLWFAGAAAVAAATAVVLYIAITPPQPAQPSRPAATAPPAMPAVLSVQPAPSEPPPDIAPAPAPGPAVTPPQPASAVPAAAPPAATPPASHRPPALRRIPGRSPAQPPRPAKDAIEPAVSPAAPPQAPAQATEPAPAPAPEPGAHPAPAHPAVPPPAPTDEDPLERP